MRTTLTIDDQIAAELKRRAYESGRSFKEVVNEALRRGIQDENGQPSPRQYRIDAASMGEARDGVDLRKATALAGALEDDELARKMRLRK